MAKLLYSTTMSLDGFVAGPDGDMSWLTPYIGPNPPVEAIISEIGSLLIGRRTYDGDDPHKGTEAEGKAFGGGWEGPQFVLTHRPPAASPPDTTFLTDLSEAVMAAKGAAGEKYVNIMGPSVARQCIAAGLLDEVLVCIAPLLLGDGTRLFDVAGGHNIELERLSVIEVPLATVVRLAVVR